MCGRAYETYSDAELACFDEHGEPPDLDWLSPNYNLAPTEMSPVVLIRDGAVAFEEFRWGLVPPWAKSVQAASRYSLINARGEEIQEKRSYAEAFQRRRCIVPLSGFYEWKREGTVKRPFAIQLREQPIMAVAAVWERWQPTDDKAPIQSFSIVTTRANTVMADIHDRMPVILSYRDVDQWLDPEVQDPERVYPLVRPCPAEWLAPYEVSTLVNSVRNKSAELVLPVTRGEYQRALEF